MEIKSSSFHRAEMALIFVIVAVGILGCAPETRYKTLSFFFDGVPNPKEKVVAQANDTNANNANKNAETGKVQYREHGPFAARLCGGCHVPGSNNLVVPIEELCIRCHTTVLSGKRNIHGPVASGGCKVCHEPHGSNYRYFLVADSKTFCLHCHNKDDIMKREVHRSTEMQCTSCHDAHGSDSDYLLK